MSTLANNIKKYRKEKGLTQGQLAEMIGKSKNVIFNWENGLNKPDADTIETLMWALGVTALLYNVFKTFANYLRRIFFLFS